MDTDSNFKKNYQKLSPTSQHDLYRIGQSTLGDTTVREHVALVESSLIRAIEQEENVYFGKCLELMEDEAIVTKLVNKVFDN